MEKIRNDQLKINLFRQHVIWIEVEEMFFERQAESISFFLIAFNLPRFL